MVLFSLQCKTSQIFRLSIILLSATSLIFFRFREFTSDTNDKDINILTIHYLPLHDEIVLNKDVCSEAKFKCIMYLKDIYIHYEN